MDCAEANNSIIHAPKYSINEERSHVEYLVVPFCFCFFIELFCFLGLRVNLPFFPFTALLLRPPEEKGQHPFVNYFS